MKWTLRVICLMFLLVPTTHAQFMVQPMRMDISKRPGTNFQRKLIMENRNPDQDYYVELKIEDLIQTEDGGWDTVDNNDLKDPTNQIDLSNHKSCKKWLKLGTTSSIVRVPRYARQPVELDIRIPPGVRGFYCAAIVASLLPRPDQIGVPVTYDFVVPVMVTLEGRPLRHDIKMVSAGLEFVQAGPNSSASTGVTIGIENTGETYGRIVGVAKVMQVIGKRKVPVINETVFDEIGIIPTSKLKIQKDLRKTLPSGRYQVRAAMFVDGMRIRDIEQDVSFTGDGIGAARADAIVQMEPYVAVDAQPGRTKREYMTVTNNSTEDILIKAIAVVPKSMQGKALGGIPGDYLSCAPWIEIKPNELSLRSMRKRKISIAVRMPDEANRPQMQIDPGAYYADLQLYAFYPDATSAGVFTSKICVRDSRVEPVYELFHDKWRVEDLGGSKRKVTVDIYNRSFVHMQPRVTASIFTPAPDNDLILHFALKGAQSGLGNQAVIMLPFEKRSFSGEVDCASIAPGMYRLEASLEYMPGQMLNPRPRKALEVYVQNNQKGLEFTN